MVKISLAYVPLTLLVVLILGALVGCANSGYRGQPDGLRIALAQIKDEHVRLCEGLGPEPEHTIYGFHEDYNLLAAIAAQCRTRHNELVGLLLPLIKQARIDQGGTPGDDKKPP